LLNRSDTLSLPIESKLKTFIMRKTFTLIGLTLGLFATGHAQVLFQEDFDGISGDVTGGQGTYTFPSGWVLINGDGLIPATQVSYVNDAWERLEDFANDVNDSAAFSTSWYGPPAGTANDWMWTPPVTLGANCVLSWNALAYDVDFPDGYEVRIWTAGGTPTSVTGASTVLQSISAENNTWTNRMQSLAAYNGQTVRIGFRNNSNDMFLLLIDDVTITQLVNTDAEIIASAGPSEYSMVPVSQLQPLTATATIRNSGLQNITGVGLEADVYDGSFNLLGTAPSASTNTLTPGTSADFSTIGVTPPGIVDTYYIDYWAVLNETDQIGSNNTLPFYYTLGVTETMYGRDDATVTGALGIGAGEGGYLGNSFEIVNTTYLDSVFYYVTQGYSSAAEPTSAVIWSTVGGVPNQIIGSTVMGSYQTDTEEVIVLPMQGGPMLLNPGTYVITAVEYDSTLTLGYCDGIFTPGTSWVNWPTNGWSNSEEFGAAFEVTYVIRAIINDNPVGLQQMDASHTVQVMPNPATDDLTVRFNNSSEQRTTISLTDISGRTVHTEEGEYMGDIRRNIDVSNLAPGVYMLSVSTSAWSKVERVVVK
jgi:hypothetical protein